MNVLLSVISAIISCAIVVVGMFLLVKLEIYLQIKRYNKRHKGQYDENTNPWTMSKRYQDWYVENFANMKEGYYDDPSQERINNEK